MMATLLPHSPGHTSHKNHTRSRLVLSFSDIQVKGIEDGTKDSPEASKLGCTDLASQGTSTTHELLAFSEDSSNVLSSPTTPTFPFPLPRLPASSTLPSPAKSCLRNCNMNNKCPSLNTATTQPYERHVAFALPENHREQHGPCPRSTNYRMVIEKMLEQCRSGTFAAETVEESDDQEEDDHKDTLMGQESALADNNLEDNTMAEDEPEWWEIASEDAEHDGEEECELEWLKVDPHEDLDKVSDEMTVSEV